MNNGIQVFENSDFGKVRVVERNGEPWFVAADVCTYFGVTNRNRIMQAVDAEDKGGTQMDTPGGIQTVAVVNESGLYSMLFALQPTKARSVSEEYIAERQTKIHNFKRWVTHEVIPSVRKHGAYITPDKIEEILINPDTIIRLCTDLKEERAKRAALEVKVETDAPKVLFAGAVETSQDSCLVGQLAKMIRQNGCEIGQNRLFDYLRNEGYLCKSDSNRNMPTQRSMEAGLFEVKESVVDNPDGSVRLVRTTKVTGKGQIYFVNKFLSGKAS